MKYRVYYYSDRSNGWEIMDTCDSLEQAQEASKKYERANIRITEEKIIEEFTA